MPEHTPGPWVVGITDDNGSEVYTDYTVKGKDRESIATTYCVVAAEGHHEANAHLIAAAPDRLNACEIALRRLNEQNGQVSEEVWNANYPADKALRDAIKKAKGE